MAAYAESSASFRHRCAEVGLSQTETDALVDQGIKSFNNLAFSVCGQPGTIDDDRFRALLTGAYTSPSFGIESMLRQLSYEAITIAVAAIKQRTEPHAEGQLKRLPPQERDERMKQLSKRITGFAIQGDYEPGHCVADFFTTMLEEAAPKYLALSKCISREQELQSLKADKRIVVLEDQQLQIKSKAPDFSADLSTDLKVQNAFVRRGIAADQANLLSYETHEQIRHFFMQHLSRPAPPGFKAPDISAVLRADKELWMKAFEQCKSDIKVRPDGKFPLGEALLALRTTPSVVFHLLPMPAGVGSKPHATKRKRSSSASSAAKPSKPKASKKPQHATKKKQSPKQNNARVKVPDALKGHSGLNKDKLRVCYNYNLPHGCSNSTHQKDGHTRCVKGIHQCIRCYKPRTMQDCPEMQ